jgi:hypothetical protein
MADIKDEAPTPGQEDGADNGFGEAFTERAENPAGDRAEAGAVDETAQAAAKAAAEPAPSKEAAGAGDSGEAPAFDPYAGMTPEAKAHWDKVAASERSQRGRVGALTKKLNGLQATAASPPPKAEEKPGAETSAEGKASAETLEAKLDAAAEEYGDVVGPLVDAVKSMRAEIAAMKPSEKRDAPAVTDAEVEEAAKAFDTLAGKHPDYEKIALDPAFHTEWLGKQSKAVVALANSNDPAEISLALTLYKAESGIASKQPGEDAGGNGGTAQDDRRARQKEGSRQPEGRGTAATGVPDDFGSAFKSRAAAKVA